MLMAPRLTSLVHAASYGMTITGGCLVMFGVSFELLSWLFSLFESSSSYRPGVALLVVSALALWAGVFVTAWNALPRLRAGLMRRPGSWPRPTGSGGFLSILLLTALCALMVIVVLALPLGALGGTFALIVNTNATPPQSMDCAVTLRMLFWFLLCGWGVIFLYLIGVRVWHGKERYAAEMAFDGRSPRRQDTPESSPDMPALQQSELPLPSIGNILAWALDPAFMFAGYALFLFGIGGELWRAVDWAWSDPQPVYRFGRALAFGALGAIAVWLLAYGIFILRWFRERAAMKRVRDDGAP